VYKFKLAKLVFHITFAIWWVLCMNLDYMESNFMCWVTTDHPPSYASNRIHDVICANCACEKQQCLGGGDFIVQRFVGSPEWWWKGCTYCLCAHYIIGLLEVKIKKLNCGKCSVSVMVRTLATLNGVLP